MADRPIPFSAPMVRALLDGRKTQTRRICKPANNAHLCHVVPLDVPPQPGWFGDEEGEVQFFSGYAPGDRLYVREEYYQFGSWAAVDGALTKGGQQKWAFDGAKPMVTFEPPADFLVSRSKTFPGIPRWYKRLGRFMPRNLSRMTLTITDVRVERLQDCSEADAWAEGVCLKGPVDCDASTLTVPGTGIIGNHAVAVYASLWNSINGKGAWEANPWVVAVSFDVRKGNIDG